MKHHLNHKVSQELAIGFGAILYDEQSYPKSRVQAEIPSAESLRAVFYE
jgi:hypothetical protein